MITLSILFDDFFDSKEHSMAELLAYSTQHYAITSNPANNPGGAFDTINTATLTALTNFATCVGDKTFNLGVRKAANQGKENFRTSLAGNLGRVAGAVEAVYGKGSPDYIACLPEGRTGITDAREDLLKGKLQALHGALVARAAEAIIAAQATVVAGWITTWTALLAAADLADGTEAGSTEMRKVCRKALTMQLSRNALTIALKFLGQPEKAPVYLPQQLLENPVAQPPGKPALEATGGAGEITVTASASGATVIHFYKRPAGSADAWAELGNGPGEEEITFDLIAPGSYEVMAKGENDEGFGPESDGVTVTVA